MLRRVLFVFSLLGAMGMVSAASALTDEQNAQIAADLAGNLSVYLSDTDLADDADAIRDFLQSNDILALGIEPGATVSKEKLDAARASFTAIQGPLESLQTVVDQLKADGPLDVPDSVIKALKETCETGTVDDVAVFSILFEASASPEQVLNAARDARTLTTDCLFYMEAAYNNVVQALRVVTGEIAAGERQLHMLEQQHEAEQDPTKKQEIADQINRKKAEIQQAKDKQERLQKQKKKLATGRLLLGLLQMGIAGVMTVASGGTCSAACASLFSSGLAMTTQAYLESTRPTTEVITSPAEPAKRKVDTGKVPTPDEVARFDVQTKDLKIIPTDQTGNVRVGVDVGGNLVILSVSPVEEIARINLASAVLTGLSDTTPDNLASLNWTKVVTLDITPERINSIVLEGMVDNKLVQFGFSERTGTKSDFEVTAQTAP